MLEKNSEEIEKKLAEVLSSLRLSKFDEINLEKINDDFGQIREKQIEIFRLYTELKSGLDRNDELYSRIVEEINNKMVEKFTEMYAMLNAVSDEEKRAIEKRKTLEELESRMARIKDIGESEEELKRMAEEERKSRFNFESIEKINLDEMRDLAEAQRKIIEAYNFIKTSVEKELSEEELNSPEYVNDLNLFNSLMQAEFNLLYSVQLQNRGVEDLKKMDMECVDCFVDLNFMNSVPASLVNNREIYKSLLEGAYQFSYEELKYRKEGGKIHASQMSFLRELIEAKDIEFTFFNADAEAYQKVLLVEPSGYEFEMVE